MHKISSVAYTSFVITIKSTIIFLSCAMFLAMGKDAGDKIIKKPQTTTKLNMVNNKYEL